MADIGQSEKRQLVNKANSSIVLFTSVASFIVVFCLVGAYTLVGQLNYQNKVIGAKKKAYSQLKLDITSTETLVEQYKAFVSNPLNVLGGDPQGSGAQDGDNAKIVLDALPSKYDFPALATSLEKILKDQGVSIQSINGTDDEIAQGSVTSSTPAPVTVPFQFSVKGDYNSIKKVVAALERSIRPIQIQTMQLTGSEQDMTLNVSAQTYFQPAKNLNIRQEVVK
jgi:Tfp pilus assembly protein PilO